MNNIAKCPDGQGFTGALGVGQSRSPGDIAAGFLKWLDPFGIHNLAEFHTDGREHPIKSSKTFAPGAWDEIRDWVNERAGKTNLYFTANEVRPDFTGAKPGKKDILRIRALGADVDPKEGTQLDVARSEIRRRLMGFDSPKFSTIIDSGGGFQGLLLLDQKIEVTPESTAWAESHGRGLGAALGSDSVQNIDRLYRLPGPDNIPTPAKRQKGRTRRPASVVSQPGGRITVDQINSAITPQAAPVGEEDLDGAIAEAMFEIEHSGYDRCKDYRELPEELLKRFKIDLAGNTPLANLWHDGKLVASKNDSGSEYRFALAGWLNRIGGYSAEEYAHLAYVWPNAVKAGDDRDEKLTVRQLARDWVRSGLSVPTKERPAEDFFDPIPQSDDTDNTAREENRQGPRLLQTLTFDEAADAALSQPAAPLVRDLLDLGAMSVVYGPSNVGKTFVVVDMAYHIAAGMTWAGHQTTKSKVLYIAAEGGRGIKNRLAALRQRYPEVANDGFFMTPASVDLRTPQGDAQAVIDTAAHLGGDFGLIVVDTLSRALAGGDENGPVDMGAFVSRTDAIRTATGAHLLVVHHSGKVLAKGARGHTCLRAATDTEIELRDGILEVTKQRDLERGPGLAFKITGTVIGLDAEGEPVKSATVTVGPISKTRAGAKPPTPTEKIVLGALERCASQSKEGNGVTAADVAAEMTAAGNKSKPDAIRKHLRRLTDKGLVSEVGHGKWAFRTKCPDMSGSPEPTPVAEPCRQDGQKPDKVNDSEIFG